MLIFNENIVPSSEKIRYLSTPNEHKFGVYAIKPPWIHFQADATIQTVSLPYSWTKRKGIDDMHIQH